MSHKWTLDLDRHFCSYGSQSTETTQGTFGVHSHEANASQNHSDLQSASTGQREAGQKEQGREGVRESACTGLWRG